jgi:hypothetical protein
LRVADVIAQLLRATILDFDTGRLVPDEEKRMIGSFIGAMFWGDGDDEGMRRLVAHAALRRDDILADAAKGRLPDLETIRRYAQPMRVG